MRLGEQAHGGSGAFEKGTRAQRNAPADVPLESLATGGNARGSRVGYTPPVQRGDRRAVAGSEGSAMATMRTIYRHVIVAAMFVAMTAQAMKGDRDRCISAGMDDYISKPVRIVELSQTLVRWLQAVTSENIIRANADNQPEITEI